MFCKVIQFNPNKKIVWLRGVVVCANVKVKFFMQVERAMRQFRRIVALPFPYQTFLMMLCQKNITGCFRC